MKKINLSCLVLIFFSCFLQADNRYPFEALSLDYSYSDLEPHIDQETMKIHYECHYKNYLAKLNEALLKSDNLHKIMSIEHLVVCNSLPKALEKKIKDFGGGFINHSLYFDQFLPVNKVKISPDGALLKSIEKYFKSVDNFKLEFNKKAMSLFGSGWVWLILKPNGYLKIITRKNQDPPHTIGIPLIGIDMWEHAYYLKHNCKKIDYVNSFWAVLDWAKIEKRLELKCLK